MAQNNTERNNARFAEIISFALRAGRSVHEIGRTTQPNVGLIITGLMYHIDSNRLEAMVDGEVLVIGRPNDNIKVDIELCRYCDIDGVPPILTSGPGMIDTHISRVHCVIRREGDEWVTYDAGITPTALAYGAK